MAHIVDLPNGQQAEFPDEMGADQISSIIQKQFPANTPMQLSEQNPEMVDTFLGKMPKFDPKREFSPERMNEMANSAILSMPMSGGGLLNPLKNLVSNPLLKNIFNFADRPITGASVGAASTPDNRLAGGVAGGLIGSVPNALNTGKGFYNTIKNAFQKISPMEAAKSVQLFHDNLFNQAASLFNYVGNIAKDRNIGQMNMPSSMISKISKYFPDTRDANKLLENAREGDYNALRKLQTEMWERGTAKKASDFPSERDAGEELLDLRDILNDSMVKHFNDIGHPDLAKKLTDARDMYRHMKETYYSHPTISKMVDPSTRKIPRNILSVLGEKSVQMDRLRNENPLIGRILENKASKLEATNSLKKIGKIGALTAGTIGGIASLPYAYHKFTEQ